jgi:hypothetical protein
LKNTSPTYRIKGHKGKTGEQGKWEMRIGFTNETKEKPNFRKQRVENFFKLDIKTLKL